MGRAGNEANHVCTVGAWGLVSSPDPPHYAPSVNWRGKNNLPKGRGVEGLGTRLGLSLVSKPLGWVLE